MPPQLCNQCRILISHGKRGRFSAGRAGAFAPPDEFRHLPVPEIPDAVCEGRPTIRLQFARPVLPTMQYGWSVREVASLAVGSRWGPASPASGSTLVARLRPRFAVRRRFCFNMVLNIRSAEMPEREKKVRLWK